MNARVLFPALVVLVSACQSSIPFYTKSAEDPEWFKAKAAEADAKGYPATRAVPQRPTGLTTPQDRDAQIEALEKAGAEVQSSPRAALDSDDQLNPESFSRDAQNETIVPPLVDDTARPQ